MSKIIESKSIKTKSQLVQLGAEHTNIAFENIQEKRSLKQIEIEPYGNLHDYVPFWFAPRQPMLYTLKDSEVNGNIVREEDICYLVTDVNLIGSMTYDYVFYDGHPIVGYSRCFNNLSELDQVRWEIFFEEPLLDGYCKYWKDDIETPGREDRKRIRQAEFLIKGGFSLNDIQFIAVKTEHAQQCAKTLLENAGMENLKVLIKPDWYYSG